MSGRQWVIIRGICRALFRRSLYIAGTLVTALALVQIYYLVMPGSWFLRSSNVTVQTSTVGQEIPFSWCRAPLQGTIEAQATRTFYKKQPSNSFRSVSQYVFEPAIEPIDTKCQDLTLLPERQPQDGGTYYFVTDLHWMQNGYEKRLRYKSNQYVVLDSVAALLKLYREQREENEVLRQRLLELGVNPTELLSSRSDVPATTFPAPSTGTTNPPTTSAPPDPQRTTPPGHQPGLVESTVMALQPTAKTLDQSVEGLLDLTPLKGVL